MTEETQLHCQSAGFAVSLFTFFNNQINRWWNTKWRNLPPEDVLSIFKSLETNTFLQYLDFPVSLLIIIAI